MKNMKFMKVAMVLFLALVSSHEALAQDQAPAEGPGRRAGRRQVSLAQVREFIEEVFRIIPSGQQGICGLVGRPNAVQNVNTHSERVSGLVSEVRQQGQGFIEASEVEELAGQAGQLEQQLNPGRFSSAVCRPQIVDFHGAVAGLKLNLVRLRGAARQANRGPASAAAPTTPQ